MEYVLLCLWNIKKQIIYYPSKTTTILYLVTATCFGHLQPLSGHQHSIIEKDEMQYKCIHSMESRMFTIIVTL